MMRTEYHAAKISDTMPKPFHQPFGPEAKSAVLKNAIHFDSLAHLERRNVNHHVSFDSKQRSLTHASASFFN